MLRNTRSVAFGQIECLKSREIVKYYYYMNYSYICVIIKHMSKLTRQISKLDNKVVRPSMLDYVNPSAELKRLELSGAVLRLAHGYYSIVPENWREPNTKWIPTLEAAALGVAITDYGMKSVALIGPSSVRVQNRYPRPFGVAVVAIPKQRPPLKTKVGTVYFVKRDVAKLDLVSIKTGLCSGYATSLEETFIDLLRTHPDWQIGDSARQEMIHTLYGIVDMDKVIGLAKKHRGINALLNVTQYSSNYFGALEPIAV